MNVRWLWLFGPLYIALLVGLWHALTDEPAKVFQASQPPRQPTSSASEPPRKSPPPPPREQRGTLLPPPPPAATLPREDLDTPPPPKFDAIIHHTANPCTALRDPIIPESYEEVTAAGITVAWNPAVDTTKTAPFRAPFRPISIAHLVAGVLQEAAQLTGTRQRTYLTVIVDASPEDFASRTYIPAGVAQGVYDGSVRLPGGGGDLGVSLSTLRHETMHAQLHAAVGCMPFWFNEGLAKYFGGPPPVREWFEMLRTGEQFELTRLRVPPVLRLDRRVVTRMYAVAAAMIVYIVQRGGEEALRAAVRTARAMNQDQQRGSPFDLWEKLYPGARYRDVLDKLAEKIFGMTGPGLDHVFRGPFCCTGLHNLGALACRATEPRGFEQTWVEETSVPPAQCRVRWW